jgi:hypothetical protein
MPLRAPVVGEIAGRIFNDPLLHFAGLMRTPLKKPDVPWTLVAGINDQSIILSSIFISFKMASSRAAHRRQALRRPRQ